MEFFPAGKTVILDCPFVLREGEEGRATPRMYIGGVGSFIQLLTPYCHPFGEADKAIVYWMKCLHNSNPKRHIEIWSVDQDCLQDHIYYILNSSVEVANVMWRYPQYEGYGANRTFDGFEYVDMCALAAVIRDRLGFNAVGWGLFLMLWGSDFVDKKDISHGRNNKKLWDFAKDNAILLNAVRVDASALVQVSDGEVWDQQHFNDRYSMRHQLTLDEQKKLKIESLDEIDALVRVAFKGLKFQPDAYLVEFVRRLHNLGFKQPTAMRERYKLLVAMEWELAYMLIGWERLVKTERDPMEWYEAECKRVKGELKGPVELVLEERKNKRKLESKGEEDELVAKTHPKDRHLLTYDGCVHRLWNCADANDFEDVCARVKRLHGGQWPQFWTEHIADTALLATVKLAAGSKDCQMCHKAPRTTTLDTGRPVCDACKVGFVKS